MTEQEQGMRLLKLISIGNIDKDCDEVCGCRYCQNNKRTEEIIKRRDTNELINYIEELIESRHQLEFNLEVAILDTFNLWPEDPEGDEN